MIVTRILRGFGANAVGQLINLALQLTLVPVMATHWGLERYGLWILLSTIPSYLALSDLGFGTAATSQMTMQLARGDREAARSTYQSSWLLVVISTTAILILLAPAICLIPARYFSHYASVGADEIRLTLLLLTIYGIISLQGNFVHSILRATGRYATGIMISNVVALLDAALLVILALTTTSLAHTAAALLAARISMLALQFIYVRRLVPWIKPGVEHARRDTLAALWSPAAATMVLPLSNALFLQGTTAMVGLAASPAAIPAFAAVRTLVRTGVQLVSILSHAIMPEMSAAIGRGDRTAQISFVGATLALSLITLLPTAILTVLTGHYILTIWSHGTIATTTSHIAIMATSMILTGIWHPLSNLLLAANRPAAYSYAFLGAATISVICAYPGTLLLHLTGASLAMLIVDVLMIQHVWRQVRASFLRETSNHELALLSYSQAKLMLGKALRRTKLR